ncbi:MAG: ABC transporter ATP-binding protein [Thermobifida fusca]|uniref:ABC transporter ATP-binding protein n=1 Tax=Thermobifida TaxID=83677 RepID=UPI000CEEEDFA|nr:MULTISPECIES: ABC transporter ATP-binding protein [Thermobifida]MBO2529809.1 multidrug ABC transporter ATP-binding protein [Thermobifida sp.]MDD6793262.1 ABC transporter ATP-binding protein [Thermobifida fusca]PPS95484.1 ABC transporter ATPase [Thermobifida fusca]PZN60505.1 MAG: ABC transporter ATP-binding protein [Thermobifida fusca]
MNTTSQNRSVAIHVSDLHQSYGSFEAVRGVSFTVAPGELFALLGTNGAGKTTTIETLEGFRRPTRGSVRIFGIDPFGQPPELRPRVNAVLQHSGLFEELTVTESIELARDLADDPMDTAEVLEAVVLADKARNTVRSLSGGERRRLDLGLAILTRPDVLFLDEPTTGMDPEMRRETWKIISSQVARGAAVVLTTHYLEEAERLADRLAIMHRGEIRVSGTVSEVVSQWGDRISFRLPSHIRSRELPELPGAELTIDVRGGHQWAVYTVTTGTDPATRTHHALLPLLKWAEERSLDLERLESRPASLEDVFLAVAQGDVTDLVDL